MTRSLKAAAAVLVLGNAAAVQAAPVQWTIASGGNDHWYEYVGVTNVSWAAAQAAALAATHAGTQGYLATLTSAAEQSFLLTIGQDGWLGGSDAAVEGEWRWSDGPEAGTLFWTGGPGGTASGYASWNGNEPNDAGGEDYLHLNFGRWNDAGGGPANFGYFVEYNAAPPPPPSGLPLPGSLSLAGLALGTLAVLRRRRTPNAC